MGILERAVVEHARGAGRSSVACELLRSLGAGDEYPFGVRTDALTRDPSVAGRLYEVALSAERDTRRALGAWYTPPVIARHLVRYAVRPGARRIIDPAAGSGVFLLEAAHHLSRSCSREDAARTLWAIDCDPDVLAVARGILRAAGFDVPADHFVVADALVDPWPAATFDVVLGNPPFVNIVRLPPALRAALRLRYRTFRNKCDLYGLFVEAASEHLEPDGRLGFVLSDSFLGTSSFVPLRRLLFDGSVLSCERVDRIDGRVFAGVAVRTLAVMARRGPGGKGGVEFGSVDARGRKGRSVLVPHRVMRARIGVSAAPPPSSGALQWAEDFAKDCTPLGELMTLSLGVKTGNDARFVSDRREGKSWVRCLRGRQLRRWRTTPTQWLDYRPAVLKQTHGARPRKRGSFERPAKLLLRETAGPQLIAAYDPEGLVPLDTVHAIYSPEPNTSLWYLLGILNAAPTSRWYGMHHPGPHVKAGEVRALPVPDPRPSTSAALMQAIPAAVAWLADPSAPVPARVTHPDARTEVIALLARHLSTAGPHRERAVALLDHVVARAYGVEP